MTFYRGINTMENMEHEKKFVDLLGFSIINTEKKDYYKTTLRMVRDYHQSLVII